jgi:hypothetical protein
MSAISPPQVLLQQYLILVLYKIAEALLLLLLIVQMAVLHEPASAVAREGVSVVA